MKLKKQIVIYVSIFFIFIFIYLYIWEIPRQRCTNLLKKYNKLKINMHLNNFEKIFGKPDYIIRYWDNSEVLYYIGCDKSFFPSETLKRYNNKILQKPKIIDEYGYFELLFDEKNLLKCYLYCGENSGSSMGGIAGYFVNKRANNFKKINIGISNYKNILKLFGVPDQIKTFPNKGILLMYFAIRDSKEIYKINPANKEKEELLPLLPRDYKNKIYFKFFVNKNKILEAKENFGDNIYNSVYGKITIKKFLQLIDKKAGYRN